jgi:DNA-binding NtrC family response regulator
MAGTHQTERQEDSAARMAQRDGAALAHVRIVFGRSSRAVYEVRSTGTNVGRGSSDAVCDVEIDDSLMSRVHVQIERNVDRWQLVDLGSRNGGYVDGRGFDPGASTPLADGAVIRLGGTLLVFRGSAPDRDTRTDAHVFPGVSPAANLVRRRIDQLVSASGHVLVLGETGTGKERVARAIAGNRAGRQFVTQNCAELTRDLARSELFGHVRGAFSGALHNKPGLVDLVGDGVLFLDEIGELALDVQGDLLRFLEDGSYRPIGSGELKHSDARVVAATNVDLDQAVAANKFRRDLLARLRASNEPIELAPLRDRREDIPLWAQLFLTEAGHASPDGAWTAGSLECLLLYPWLDNLRELRRVVRAVVADRCPVPCATEDLPLRIRTLRSTLRGHVAAPPPADDPGPRRDPTREELEDVLRRTQGRVRSAAKELGIERRKLYRLCERFDIALKEHREALHPDDD